MSKYSPADACLYKTQYPSKTAAKKSLRGRRRSRKEKLNNSRPTDVYRCPFCNSWHIGHRPRGK